MNDVPWSPFRDARSGTRDSASCIRVTSYSSRIPLNLGSSSCSSAFAVGDNGSPELLETVPELLGVGAEAFELGNSPTGLVFLFDSPVDDGGIAFQLLLRRSVDALVLCGLVGGEVATELGKCGRPFCSVTGHHGFPSWSSVSVARGDWLLPAATDAKPGSGQWFARGGVTHAAFSASMSSMRRAVGARRRSPNYWAGDLPNLHGMSYRRI